MKDNLPIKEENTSSKNIKIFKKLFARNVSKNGVEENIENQPPVRKNTNGVKFQESIKVNVKNAYIDEQKREEFLDELEENPELFYKLPIEKLEKLENYYKTSITKYEEKLAKVKKAI